MSSNTPIPQREQLVTTGRTLLTIGAVIFVVSVVAFAIIYFRGSQWDKNTLGPIIGLFIIGLCFLLVGSYFISISKDPFYDPV